MINKKDNIFSNIDTSSLIVSLTNFMNYLSEINYENSGYFLLDTLALYDNNFNDAILKLKNEDIQKMINLIDDCMSNVVNKIIDYNKLYDDSYLPSYNTYSSAYTTYDKTPATYYEESTVYNSILNKYITSNEEKTNPAKKDALDALNNAEDSLNTILSELDKLEKNIQTYSFSSSLST